MIKALVVDDSLFMRRLVSDMLNSNREIEVVDIAKNGSEAIDKIHKCKPDAHRLNFPDTI